MYSANNGAYITHRDLEALCVIELISPTYD